MILWFPKVPYFILDVIIPSGHLSLIVTTSLCVRLSLPKPHHPPSLFYIHIVSNHLSPFYHPHALSLLSLSAIHPHHTRLACATSSLPPSTWYSIPRPFLHPHFSYFPSFVSHAVPITSFSGISFYCISSSLHDIS